MENFTQQIHRNIVFTLLKLLKQKTELTISKTKYQLLLKTTCED